MVWEAFTAMQLRECDLCHKWLGRPSSGSLCSLSSVLGFKLNKTFDECCDVCHCAKQTWNSFSLSSSKVHRLFSLIHWDLWGPYHILSLNGCCYFLCIVDDFNRAV